MRKNLALATGLLVCILSAGCDLFSKDNFAAGIANSAEGIKYTVTVIPVKGSSVKLDVDVEFTGDNNSFTSINLPCSFASADKLYVSVKNLRSVTPQVTIEDDPRGNECLKIVNHSSAQKVHLKYSFVSVPQAPQTPPSRGPGAPPPPETKRQDDWFYRAILQKDYFHVLGHTFFVNPNWASSDKVPLEIYWILPDHWRVANNFGSDQPNQNLKQAPVLMSNLREGIFAGGSKLKLETKEDSRVGVIRFAINGNFRFKDEVLHAFVPRVLSEYKTLFGDEEPGDYFVAMQARKDVGLQKIKSLEGHAHPNSFTAYFPANRDWDYLAKHLIAHELFHLWNGVIIEGGSGHDLRWFSEGFTDYYAMVTLRRIFLTDKKMGISAQELAKLYNEDYNHYHQCDSKYPDLTNAVLAENYYKDKNLFKVPYHRGMLLAANWDSMIRLGSLTAKSLDDVMRGIFRDAKDGTRLSYEIIKKWFGEYAKTFEISKDIEEHITKGKLITPAEDALGGSFTFRAGDKKPFQTQSWSEERLNEQCTHRWQSTLVN